MNRAEVIEPVEPYALTDGWGETAFEPWVIIVGVIVGLGAGWWWRRQSKSKRR
jgi:hypothetical protein